MLYLIDNHLSIMGIYVLSMDYADGGDLHGKIAKQKIIRCFYFS